MKLRSTFIILSTAICSSAFAANTPWLIRARAIDVIPYASSGTLSVIGGKVDSINTQVVPELDFSYFITPNIAAELILATARHSVAANHTAIGHVDLGKVNLLPPTLTLQYHFLPNCQFNPYVGVGVNYTYFYNVDHGSNPAVNSISYENTFGPALQIGADYMIDDHWLVNVDVKKVYIQPEVTVNTAVGKLTPTVHIDPVIVGIGVGYRF